MFRRWSAAVALASLAFVLPASAAAQSQNREPGAAKSPLNVVISWLNGLDAISQETEPRDPEARSELTLVLDYAKRSRRGVFAVSAVSSAAMRPDMRVSRGVSQGLELTLSRQVSRRTMLEMAIDGSYAPMNLAGQLSGGVELGPGSLSNVMADVEQQHERRASGTVTVTRVLGRRSTAAFAYTYSAAALADGANASMQMALLRFTRQVSKFAAFRAGYGAGYGQAGSVSRHETALRHDIDLGMQYERPLPFAGRTVVGMSTGTSVFRDGASQRLRLMVEGRLAHTFSDRWSARVDYSRPIRYLAGVADPVLSDTIAGSIGGRMTRSTEMALIAGYSRGGVGFESRGQDFTSRTLTAQLRARVARGWWFEAQAFTAAYSFSSADALAGPLAAEFSRHGVRGGLSWAPPLRP